MKSLKQDEIYSIMTFIYTKIYIHENDTGVTKPYKEQWETVHKHSKIGGYGEEK